MTDTSTFFARISSFFLVFWAYILRVLSIKHKSTTLCDDLEVGIPSAKRRVSGNFNTALPVVSGSCPIDGFFDICLIPDSKTTKTDVISIATHNVPTKASVIETGHFQPTVKIVRSVSVLFPAVVDNWRKHSVVQFGPYSLDENYLQSRSRKRQDSFSDLLDLFPVPPAYVPLLQPVINGDVIPQTVEKTPLAPAESPSPTICEVVSLSSGSTDTSSTDPPISISISNETADSSVHEILEIPFNSAVFKVLSSEIDVKNKNISRLTLIQNPEIVLLPATDVRNPSTHSHYAIGPKSFCAFTKKALPQTYHDVVDSSEQADLQKGDISRVMLSEEVDTPAVISEDHDLQSLEDSLAPIPNLEDSSHRSLDELTSVRAPVQVVPAEPNKWVRPYVAPLIVKKVQPPVVPLGPLVTRRPLSGNWEQAMNNVLQSFWDAELEGSNFRGLFSGDDSFLTQSSEISSPRDDRGYLDDHGDEYERRLEESFYSIDESLSKVIAPADLVVLKVEDPANVSLSSERVVSRLVMLEVENELHKVNVPEPRLCDCEGCEDYHPQTVATDDDDDDNYSQEDDQWSERLDLNEYVS